VVAPEREAKKTVWKERIQWEREIWMAVGWICKLVNSKFKLSQICPLDQIRLVVLMCPIERARRWPAAQKFRTHPSSVPPHEVVLAAA
jgi:hypothetical protein